MARGRGNVYMIYDLEERTCKVGHTKNPAARFSTLGVYTKPHLLLVLNRQMAEPFNKRVEKLIQEHIANARTPRHGSGGTEWFRISLEHAEWIADLTERFLDAINADDPGNREYETVSIAMQAARDARARASYG